MDVKAWQRRLRDFAAARDWQPYHAPKNLAMALMVEAAELLELFQWQTLTESRGFTREAQNKERAGDEMADVLLYLLQLADHTGVDLEQALERKLAKNAAKHPAKNTAQKALPTPLAASEALPAKVHLLVDWENVQPMGPALQALVPEGSDVWLFHGPQQRVDASSHVAAYGIDGVTHVPRSGVGRNALDFQLSYYVGYISARQPRAAFVIVSNDQGYDPMLEHARELGFHARRLEYRKPAVATEPVKPQKVPQSASAPKAPSLPSIVKATRQEMQMLAQLLADMPAARRPAHKSALLDLLQNHLGEVGRVSPRVEHALSQLRAQKQVMLKGDGVSYPAPVAAAQPQPQPQPQPVVPSTASKQSAAVVGKPQPKAAKKASAAPADPGKPAPLTTAQIMQRVLASLKKMPENKPTRYAGMIKHIASHASQASDPQGMARQVFTLLEHKKHVILSPDGLRVSYPGLVGGGAVRKAVAKTPDLKQK